MTSQVGSFKGKTQAASEFVCERGSDSSFNGGGDENSVGHKSEGARERVHLPRKMWGNPQSGRDKGSKDANYVEGPVNKHLNTKRTSFDWLQNLGDS